LAKYLRFVKFIRKKGLVTAARIVPVYDS